MPDPQDPPAIVRDPVCAMIVADPANAPSHQHAGHAFHFCSSHCHTRFGERPEDYLEAKDPVCGMSVFRATAKHVAKHEGERFYFCCERCHDRFVDAPEDWLGERPPPCLLYTSPSPRD